MSVPMTLKVKGDPAKLERFAAENPDRFESIVELGVSSGYHFYGNGSAIIVADEWPIEDEFNAFLAPPEVTFWRKLETRDDADKSPSIAASAA